MQCVPGRLVPSPQLFAQPEELLTVIRTVPVELRLGKRAVSLHVHCPTAECQAIWRIQKWDVRSKPVLGTGVEMKLPCDHFRTLDAYIGRVCTCGWERRRLIWSLFPAA